MKHFFALSTLFACTACSNPGLEPKSASNNPLGWPAKAFSSVGTDAAASGLPGVRELGRLSYGVGDILESPALLVEGVVTLNPSRAFSSLPKLHYGVGGAVSACVELPFFFLSARNIDLSPYAPLVNDALAYLDRTTPAPGQDRIFPVGTRVRASGKNLIWTIPGEGDVLQVAEESLIFRAGNWAMGEEFSAQERGFGFVVPDATPWPKVDPWQTETLIHEFYHQYREIDHWFSAWEPLYFVAYFGAYPIQGYENHWAESSAKNGAYRVQDALRNWRPPIPARPLPASTVPSS